MLYIQVVLSQHTYSRVYMRSNKVRIAMGFAGISTWQLVIVAAIILMLFGTKRLRNLGGDLGDSIKGFRKSIKDDSESSSS